MASRFEFDPKQAQAMGFVWEFLVAMLVPLVLFALGGRWLDEKLGTTPWLTVVSFPCALTLAYRVIRSKVEKLKRDVYGNLVDHPSSTSSTSKNGEEQ